MRFFGGMPQRPRSHEIETETRNAFAETLPSAWIYRPTSPDYGLDGEVELFEEGRATGQRFAVQLKGTDSADGGQALAIRLRAPTCLYYRSLDVPVLVVRYVAPSGRLYAQWFHALDQDWDSLAQQTVTLRLSESDEWDETTASRLVHGLRAFRWVHQPALDLPLAFRVVGDGPEVLGRPIAEWGLLIRQAMARAPGLLSAPLIEETAPPTPTIELTDSTLRVNLLDVVSMTIPTAPMYDDPAAEATLPEDAMICIALALEKAGHVGLAGRIAVEYAYESRLIGEAAVAVMLAQTLSRDHRVVDALEIAAALKARGEEFVMASWFFEFAALSVAHVLSGRERARYREYLETLLDEAAEGGDDHQTAIAHYNLANKLRGTVPPVDAFHHYRMAAKLFPAYGKFEYWCREVAGTLHEGGRYAAAVFFYERARELESDWPLAGVLGDALMFAGRYAEAEASFGRALESSEPGAPEWALKQWAIANLRERTGIDVQARMPGKADDLASIDEGDPQTSSSRRLEAALDADLLCGLAWFNYGVQSNQEDNKDGAFFCFLMAALCQRGDTEAWANALALAVESDRHLEFVPAIAQAAYFANGDAMLEQMAIFAQGQPDEFPRTEFLNAMEQILRVSPSPATAAPEIAAEDRAAHERLDLDPPDMDETYSDPLVD